MENFSINVIKSSDRDEVVSQIAQNYLETVPIF